MATRFSGPGLPYEGLTTKGKWNGTIRVVDDKLTEPLTWRKPRRVFVNSMSDLFHEPMAQRAPYSPVIGEKRREMKAGHIYTCQTCGARCNTSPYLTKAAVAARRVRQFPEVA